MGNFKTEKKNIIESGVVLINRKKKKVPVLFLIGTKLHMQNHEWMFIIVPLTVYYIFLSTYYHWSNKNVKLLTFSINYLSL